MAPRWPRAKRGTSAPAWTKSPNACPTISAKVWPHFCALAMRLPSRHHSVGEEARPHPDPLPRERERTCAAPETVMAWSALPIAGRASPSPWGEGSTAGGASRLLFCSGGEEERFLATMWGQLKAILLFLLFAGAL